MKQFVLDVRLALLRSRPARGAWIETKEMDMMPANESRAPRGARGLKPV